MVRRRLEAIGFTNFAILEGKLCIEIVFYFSTHLLVLTVSPDSKSIHNPKFMTLFSGSPRCLCFFAIVLIYKRGNPRRQTVDC